MKLVITIEDDIYDDYLKQGATLPKYGTAINSLYEALWNGVPLPEHHGRLIDADRLTRAEILHLWYHLPNGDIACPKVDIDHAPTIIEGSENE